MLETKLMMVIRSSLQSTSYKQGRGQNIQKGGGGSSLETKKYVSRGVGHGHYRIAIFCVNKVKISIYMQLPTTFSRRSYVLFGIVSCFLNLSMNKRGSRGSLSSLLATSTLKQPVSIYMYVGSDPISNKLLQRQTT